MAKVIGIDLGTTNSCVAVMEGNEPVVVPNSEGKRTTPSVVAFLDGGKGERRVGDPAKRQAITNPKNTIYSIKRLMGKAKVKDFRVPYDTLNAEGGVRVKIGDRKYSPEEISAMVLQKMKSSAEEYLGTQVKEAVITVPAYFGDSERQATKDAGKIAGLEVKRVINEPTAAALAYGLDKRGKDLKVAVYDLGGGTFDISILELGDGVFEVKATEGDVELGGDDFDDKIIEWLAEEFQKQEGVDLRKDPMALQRLKEASEKAKIELSNGSETEINLPYIMPVDGVPKHLVQKLSKAKFEQLSEDLIQRTLKPCEKALKAAKIKASDIDEVILVGGSTRIPRVQEEVETFFGKKPSKGVNPDEVVALGAAVQGGVFTGDVKDVVLLDVTPLKLGIETLGGVFTTLIEANTTIPTKKSEVFSTAEDNQPSVEVHVLQGNRPMAQDNRSLGRFHLDGIPPAARGVPQVEVTFDINADGILHVSAKDKGTHKEQNIRIEAASTLSEQEIERMKKEAERNASEDAKNKERVEKLNLADQLVFSTEKQLKELGDKLDAAKKKPVEEALADLKEAVKKRDLPPVEAATKKLNEAFQKISEDLYKAAQEKAKQASQSDSPDSSGSSDSSSSAPNEGGTQDTTFEEVDKEKKK